MNKDFLKGSWEQIRGRIKSEWGKLTDDEIRALDKGEGEKP